jgi:beta-lactamase class A
MQRRAFLTKLATTVTALPAWATSPAAPTRSAQAASRALASLEAHSGGTLAVLALDTGSGRTIGWRQDARMPLCSTFKALLAAVVLQRVDRGEAVLTRAIPIEPTDLLQYAPRYRQTRGRHAEHCRLVQGRRYRQR